MSYSGWTNYATWSVNLWVDNEERDYRLKVEYLQQLKHKVTDMDVRRFVKDYMDNTTPDLSKTVEGARFEDINWSELAGFWEEERLNLTYEDKRYPWND